MRRIVGAGAALLIACAADSQPDTRPTSCEKTQRSGTYMMTYAEQSGGTCGAMPSGLVRFDPNAPAGDGCMVQSEAWSEGDCTLERDVTCTGTYASPTQYGGKGAFTNHMTAVTRQVTADGSRIEGTITMRIELSSGACSSTYAVVATRQ